MKCKMQCRRIDIGDWVYAKALEQKGWREVEQLVTWARRPERIPSRLFIRRATIRDMPYVAKLAWQAFSHDRRHVDPDYPNFLANLMKAKWALSRIREKMVKIAVFMNCRAGFIVLDRPHVDIINIELIAVSDRKKGVGKALVGHALDEAARNSDYAVMVGTQATNSASNALYASMGFERVQIQRTFHKGLI